MLQAEGVRESKGRTEVDLLGVRVGLESFGDTYKGGRLAKGSMARIGCNGEPTQDSLQKERNEEPWLATMRLLWNSNTTAPFTAHTGR